MSLLHVLNLSYSYKRRDVLKDISFSIQAGEIVGLLGPNGAGKSTLFRLLSGLFPLQSGQIEFDGHAAAVQPHAVSVFARRHIGVMSQEPSLDKKLSVYKNLALAATLYGVSLGEVSDRIYEALTRVGLSDRIDEQVKNLSGGMQKRVELARVLLHRPRLLLLDEPTAGLDEESSRQFWRLLRSVSETYGAAVLLTTHRLEEAERCHRLLLLHEGKIAHEGTPNAIRSVVRLDTMHIRLRDDAAADKAMVLTERFVQLSRSKSCEIVGQLENAATLIPEVVEALPKGSIEAIWVQKPSLADAYLQLTGAALGVSDNA